ncbi:MAG: inositol monophosphatase family protein, partial [Candidatus Sulfotelmatobacter sp.]
MDGFNQPSHSASRGLPQPAARGTREFVEGIPEFCVSVGFVGNSHPVAGGIYNPATDETVLGSIKSDVRYNGKPCRPSHAKTLDGALVLVSRSEVMRGE